VALIYIHQMNRMNSRNDLVVMITALQISSWVLLLLFAHQHKAAGEKNKQNVKQYYYYYYIEVES